MDVYSAILSKRDLRGYSDRPIADEVLQRILQAGRMAGSSKNSQPCRFIVIRSREQREALAACGDYAAHMLLAPLAIAVLLLPDGGAFDAGRAAQNMMLAAWEEGIISCPTSMHRPAEAQKVLGLPPDCHLQITLPMGYPAEGGKERPSRPRLPLDDYVRFERW